jgi:WS/DGAT/MGAT family acyltransferase
LWVDDPQWRIDRHVTAVEAPSPGDEAALLRLADDLLATPLDRAHPLWRIWLVTGLSGGRVGAIVAVHHALADGPAGLRLLAVLVDPAGAAVEPASVPWRPVAPPTWSALVVDNFGEHLARLGRLMRRLRPARAPTRIRSAMRSLAVAWSAPRTSLNAPVGPRQRSRIVRLDLDAVRAVAHRNGATVNAVVLELAAAGLYGLLAGRGETVDRALHVAIPVTPRSIAPADVRTGNRSGIVIARLPLEPTDPLPRLAAIHRLAGQAQREQVPLGGVGLPVGRSCTALARAASRHQHLTNVVVSNVAGPSGPLRLLGARVVDLLPLGVLSGNLAVSFLAFSYAGTLTITVRADADRFPDLDVLVAAMSADWQRLDEAIPVAG